MPVVFARVKPASFLMLQRVWDFVLLQGQISPRREANQCNWMRTWSNCPPCRRQPTCYTIYLPMGEYALKCRDTGLGHALYSFPVCGAVSLSTSPGFTCFRAGFSFFCFGTTAFAVCASTCVSVLLLLIVSFQAESHRTLKF